MLEFKGYFKQSKLHCHALILYLTSLLRGAELFEAKVKKVVAARLELEMKSVETLKKQ